MGDWAWYHEDWTYRSHCETKPRKRRMCTFCHQKSSHNLTSALPSSPFGPRDAFIFSFDNWIGHNRFIFLERIKWFFYQLKISVLSRQNPCRILDVCFGKEQHSCFWFELAGHVNTWFLRQLKRTRKTYGITVLAISEFQKQSKIGIFFIKRINLRKLDQ